MSFSRKRRASSDPWDSFVSHVTPYSYLSYLLPAPSLPEHSGFARDVAAVANTQVDWKETRDSHVFFADLPGLTKEDVKVQVEDGCVLQISGKKKEEETSSSSDRWHTVERVQGSFLRRFRLPEDVKLEEVKAAMENGVLTITVPKAPPPEPKPVVRNIAISG